MKLRHILVITFCLIVIIPMTLFWIWPYSKALESEVQEVSQKHLVIAKNLSAAFERYYQDVTGFVSIIEPQSQNQLKSPAFQKLLEGFEFREIALIENNGMLKNCLFSVNPNCSEKTNNDILNLVKTSVKENAIQISTVTEDENITSGPIFLVTQKKEDGILLAYLSTKYIVEMGKRVAFGEKGHAAIVDQAGNVLAHPLDSWIQERKNISKLSPVKKMLSGETGVTEFYSPALKGDMIAGYTYVPNAHWGVMIPQPIKELKDKAETIDETAILVMLLGLGLALIITIPISFILIKPLENLSRIIKLIEKGSARANLEQKTSKLIPLEIRDLNKSFFDMMNNLEKNKEEISKLAYIDSQTGLPNRNYFYRLSKEILNQMLKRNQKGALIFIDFDGFKAVNDTYGHKVGDELLFMFGKQLTEHLSQCGEHKTFLSFSPPLPEILPARIGGDEFVILCQNIKDKNEVEIKIKALTQKIFSEYTLENDIRLTLTGSVGIALFPEHGQRYDTLMRQADIAMYNAKYAGKDGIQFAK